MPKLHARPRARPGRGERKARRRIRRSSTAHASGQRWRSLLLLLGLSEARESRLGALEPIVVLGAYTGRNSSAADHHQEAKEGEDKVGAESQCLVPWPLRVRRQQVFNFYTRRSANRRRLLAGRNADEDWLGHEGGVTLDGGVARQVGDVFDARVEGGQHHAVDVVS